MASTHGMTGIAGRSVYGISKAGLIQMTKMLAIEWADKGIRVNAVAPATVMTASREKLLSDLLAMRLPIDLLPMMVPWRRAHPRQRHIRVSASS